MCDAVGDMSVRLVTVQCSLATGGGPQLPIEPGGCSTVAALPSQTPVPVMESMILYHLPHLTSKHSTLGGRILPGLIDVSSVGVELTIGRG